MQSFQVAQCVEGNSGRTAEKPVIPDPNANGPVVGVKKAAECDNNGRYSKGRSISPDLIVQPHKRDAGHERNSNDGEKEVIRKKVRDEGQRRQQRDPEPKGSEY